MSEKPTWPPPVYSFRLPNGDVLRMVRRDIMDRALKREPAGIERGKRELLSGNAD